MSGRDLRGHLAWPFDEELRRRHAAAVSRLRRRMLLHRLRDIAVCAFWLAVIILDCVGIATLTSLADRLAQ